MMLLSLELRPRQKVIVSDRRSEIHFFITDLESTDFTHSLIDFLNVQNWKAKARASSSSCYYFARG